MSGFISGFNPDYVWFQTGGSAARSQSWRGRWVELQGRKSIGSSLSPKRNLLHLGSLPHLQVPMTTLAVVSTTWSDSVDCYIRNWLLDIFYFNENVFCCFSIINVCFVSPPQDISACVWALLGRSDGACCGWEACTCRRTPGISGPLLLWCP